MLKVLFIAVGGMMLGSLALGLGLRSELLPAPELPGTLSRHTFNWDDLPRSYEVFVPENLAARPALVFVLHASLGDASTAPQVFGYGFRELAAQEGFVVVYPEGVERHWNDCRARANYAARRLNVDDVGFLRALRDSLLQQYDADPRRSFIAGVSNGGQMAYRMALESPQTFAAHGAVIAGLPTADNLACTGTGQPVSMLVMNGTDDPMNPDAGGDVALYGLLGNRGPVLSSDDTLAYWRSLANAPYGEPETERFDGVAGDGGSVELRRWSAPEQPLIEHYRVHGGGHTVPHPQLQFPRLVGKTNHDIVAARQVWSFFKRAAIDGERG